jgi:hypothetical protein
MRHKLTWAIFIILGFIILILDAPINWKYGINVMRELRELMKLHSRYTEDGDYQLVHKNHIFKAWRKK